MKTKNYFKQLLLIATFIITAQYATAQMPSANDFTGTWYSNHGEISLDVVTSKGVTEIKGTIGDYEIKGTLNKRTFSGAYKLNKGLNIQEDAQLKKMGIFSVEMSFDKKTFEGTFTPLGAKNAINWKATRTKTKDAIVRKGPPKKTPTDLTKKGKNTEPVMWTGTWELIGSAYGETAPRTLKIIYHDQDNIEAQVYTINANGEIFQLQKLQGRRGYGFSGSQYYFQGPYTFENGKKGQFDFVLEVSQDPTLNTMRGHLRYNTNTGAPHPVSGKNIPVTGKRLSSKIPSFNHYNQTN